MNNLTRFISTRCAFAVAGLFAVSATSSHAQSAVATISGVQDGANWDYTIVLKNTGTYDLHAFWYGWTSEGNNLPSTPLSADNSLYWDSNISGNSIIFNDSYNYYPLSPDQSATFTFSSSSNPTAMTAGAAGASVVYTYFDYSQNNPGISSDAFSPTSATPTPEPSSIGLFVIGCLGLMWVGWQKSQAPIAQTIAIRK